MRDSAVFALGFGNLKFERKFMRVFLVFIFAFSLLLGYEIKHENWGEFYKFKGDADGVKFELYLNFFDVEFENFKESKNFVVPHKIYGHIFFNGSKYEFNKGKVDKNIAQITSINALSDWINLDVRLEEDGKFQGKLAVKGKAYKAEIEPMINYKILALGVQVIDADGVKFQAVASDFFSSAFSSKFKRLLQEKIKNLKDKNSNDASFKTANDLINLEFQNSEIKNVCSIYNSSKKICKATLLKGLKQLNLEDIFKNIDDENLRAIFSKKDITPNENFTLTSAGVSFYEDGEKSVELEEIKPFLKRNFGLFDE